MVEGDDDVIIYRELTKRIGIFEVILRPSGGRDKLLQIYERRGEFSQVPVAFIADQDMWLFSGIEPGYEDVIWTSGYSIENDLYSDADLERLLDENETAEHQQILDSISTWFAFAVEEYLAGILQHLICIVMKWCRLAKLNWTRIFVHVKTFAFLTQIVFNKSDPLINFYLEENNFSSYWFVF